MKAWENGKFRGNVTADILDASEPGAVLVTFWNNVPRTQDIVVDWYGVGKYCAPEPVWGSWTPDASEPTPTPTPSPTPTASPSPTATPTDILVGIYGDATGEGEVDISDYALVRAVMVNVGGCDPRADANMDGCIDIADYALIRAIMVSIAAPHDMFAAGHDFSTGAGTAHAAAYKQVATMPLDIFPNETGWQPFNGSDYTDVEAIDASDFSMVANASGYNAVQCRFTVGGGIDLSTVTDLGINFTGTSDVLEAWAWNFSAGVWSQVCADISVPAGEGSKGEHTACDCWGGVYESYVNGSGQMYILFIHDAVNNDLDVDYVRVELTYP